MSQRIFLSSTCLDLVDLRSGLKESLEEMGYQVWASEFPDFPVDSSLGAADNCLRNVDRADQYVLIVNNRYGAEYNGTAYPKHPLAEQPKRAISVTWYEYLRALEGGKPIRILVRESIWDQRGVFQTARKSGVDLKGTGLACAAGKRPTGFIISATCRKPASFCAWTCGTRKRRTPGSSSAKCASC